METIMIEIYKDDYMTASWSPQPSNVKGCPLGRGNNKIGTAKDLISRTNMESKTSFNVKNVKIITKDWRIT